MCRDSASLNRQQSDAEKKNPGMYSTPKRFLEAWDSSVLMESFECFDDYTTTQANNKSIEKCMCLQMVFTELQTLERL